MFCFVFVFVFLSSCSRLLWLFSFFFSLGERGGRFVFEVGNGERGGLVPFFIVKYRWRWRGGGVFGAILVYLGWFIWDDLVWGVLWLGAVCCWVFIGLDYRSAAGCRCI